MHYDHFFHSCPDDLWIPEAVQRGWIIVSPDKRIETEPLNKAAVVRAKARVFLLSSKGLSGPEMASVLIVCRRRMVAMSQKPGPFIVRINAHAEIGKHRFFSPEEQRSLLQTTPARAKAEIDSGWLLPCTVHDECKERSGRAKR